MAERIPQSVAIRVAFEAYLAGTATPATGKTIAVTISKNCAAYANPSAGATNATEIASGSYYVDLSTTDTGTTGPLIVKGAEGTIDTVKASFRVVDAHNAGFDGVPGATFNTSGGVPVIGTGSNNFKSDSSARVDLGEVLGVAVNPTATIDSNVVQFGGVNGTFSGGRPEVNTTHLRGTLSAGTPGYVAQDWGAMTNSGAAINLASTSMNAVGSVTAVSSLGNNAINASSLGVDALAAIAAAWGASEIGNGRTRDYFLQGGANKVDFAADGLSFTVMSTDDSTPLYSGSATRLAGTVGALRSIDPS